MSDETLRAVETIAAKEGLELGETCAKLLVEAIRFYSLKQRARTKGAKPCQTLRLVSSPAP